MGNFNSREWQWAVQFECVGCLENQDNGNKSLYEHQHEGMLPSQAFALYFPYSSHLLGHVLVPLKQ